MAVEEQRKGLRGSLAMSDKSGASMDELGAHAAELKEELEGMGVAAGENANVIIDAFQDMAARSGKSTEELTKLTEEMVYAGKAVPGGVGAITSGFQMMEMGMIRARNPMVMMIRQTGLMTGSAKEVASALTKMATAGKLEEVMHLGEQAIGKMSEKMKAAPQTFNGVIESIKTIRENMFEAMGLPVLEALTPPLNALKHYFMDNREEIEKFAHSIGEKVGKWVLAAVDKIKEGFRYLQLHFDEIKDAITSGFETAKSVVEFILAHKEEIAIAFGANMAVKGAVSVGGAVSTAASVAGAIGEAGGAGGIAGLAKAVGGLVNPTTLAVVAVTALGVAAYQWKGLTDDLKENTVQQASTIKNHFISMASDTNKWTAATAEDMETMRQKGLLAAQGLGDAGLAGQINDLYKKAMEGHEAVRKLMEPFEEAGNAAPTAGPAGVGSKTSADEMNAYADQLEAAGNGMAGAINMAASAHSDAAIKSQASYLAHSTNLQNALLSSSTLTGEGFDALIKTLEVMSPELAAKLKGAREAMGVGAPAGTAGTHEKPPAPAVNMPGAHITIKQDFRDQDPDRVAMVFQRDLMRAATATRQSKLAGVFGF
jgi:hypothetical protein